jgi:pimeloyl-ACP methyl ester carboxylesterase
MSDNAYPEVAYGAGSLPAGVRSRFLDNGNGLTMHVLEAGYGEPGRPVVVLLHGFPELAFSWRKLLLPLAAAGYHAVAPDQRGYGRTTGWDDRFDGDVRSFGYPNLVADVVGLLDALGTPAAAVVGHDFGSPVAAWCALLAPQRFRSVTLMSAPFPGPPESRAAGEATTGTQVTTGKPAPDIHAQLAALSPPRKHYLWYYATRPADADLRTAPQGLHDFLRAYFHVKSADWPANRPVPLAGWSADQLARLPRYYVMDLDRDMPATVAPDMPAPDEVAACGWLTDAELRVYVQEYSRTGFQGGLNWYRCAIDADITRELASHAGRCIEQPACFIGGAQDWGVYQTPGGLDRMRQTACANLLGVHLLDGAGHWVQQEQADATARLLIEFLDRVS